jgi:hypothetical protein
MEQEFLRILRSALRGEHYTDAGLTAAEWREIFRLAQIHTVLPLVYEAVYDSPSLKHGAMPELAVIRMQVRHQVMVQTVKTAEFQALYDNWIKAGVRPLVVKGIVCRSLYPVPDLRSSGDEDVLVEPGQLQRCCEEMVRFGMKTELDAEAVKVVSASPKWKPGRLAGEKVRTSMTIPVEFRLEKKGAKSGFGIKK